MADISEVMETAPSYHLEVFEGPLDLLLHLIEKNKVNIYDIPIAVITDQYMEYIEEMKKADLDIMSEFLVMASTLLSIKAKMLLPKKQKEEDEEEEEDPRAALVQQLLEYKMYRRFADELRDRQLDADHVVFKEPTIPEEVRSYEQPVDLEELVSGVTLTALNRIFGEVIARQKGRVDPIRSRFGSIKKEEVSLEEKMTWLSDFARHTKTFSFRSLLESAKSRTEIVVTFLAILELMKVGDVVAVQEEPFGDITMESMCYVS